MVNPTEPASSALTRSEQALVASARSWMELTLRSYADGDIARVAVLGPLAVEHLGKAVIWRMNPVLLVPLMDGAETSLLRLAVEPDLADPRLRTVGLATLLSRLSKLVDQFPLEDKRRTRMVNVRNGAIHVGSAEDSKHILMDVLVLNETLLAQLKLESAGFYGDHHALVCSLLEEGRSDTADRVAAKLARAQQRIRSLNAELGALFQETVKSLEATSEEVISSKPSLKGLAPLTWKCPGCAHTGHLLGEIEEHIEAEWDVEPLGDGLYHNYIVGGYTVEQFSPEAFYCNVCRLLLETIEELDELELPTDDMRLEPAGDDFYSDDSL